MNTPTEIVLEESERQGLLTLKLAAVDAHQKLADAAYQLYQAQIAHMTAAEVYDVANTKVEKCLFESATAHGVDLFSATHDRWSFDLAGLLAEILPGHTQIHPWLG